MFVSIIAKTQLLKIFNVPAPEISVLIALRPIHRTFKSLFITLPACTVTFSAVAAGRVKTLNLLFVEKRVWPGNVTIEDTLFRILSVLSPMAGLPV